MNISLDDLSTEILKHPDTDTVPFSNRVIMPSSWSEGSHTSLGWCHVAALRQSCLSTLQGYKCISNRGHLLVWPGQGSQRTNMVQHMFVSHWVNWFPQPPIAKRDQLSNCLTELMKVANQFQLWHLLVKTTLRLWFILFWPWTRMNILKKMDLSIFTVNFRIEFLLVFLVTMPHHFDTLKFPFLHYNKFSCHKGKIWHNSEKIL